VEIESIRHKALRRFFETGNRKALDARIAQRLGRMLFFMANAGSSRSWRRRPIMVFTR